MKSHDFQAVGLINFHRAVFRAGDDQHSMFDIQSLQEGGPFEVVVKVKSLVADVDQDVQLRLLVFP